MESIMSLISNQIDKLRSCAKDNNCELAKLINDAADTIEVLSAKLHASNMERSSQYCNDGWIPCDSKSNVYIYNEYLKNANCNILITYRTKTGKAYVKEVWCDCGRIAKIQTCEEIIAYMPLPKPYKTESDE